MVTVVVIEVVLFGGIFRCVGAVGPELVLSGKFLRLSIALLCSTSAAIDSSVSSQVCLDLSCSFYHIVVFVK